MPSLHNETYSPHPHRATILEQNVSQPKYRGHNVKRIDLHLLELNRNTALNGEACGRNETYLIVTVVVRMTTTLVDG